MANTRLQSVSDSDSFDLVGAEPVALPKPAKPSRVENGLTDLLVVSLRALSQRALVALGSLVDLALIGSAFVLWLLIIGSPSVLQLVGVGGYAAFILGTLLLRRRA